MVLAALALAGCESAEERAERHYRSGLELIEAGDVDRALVEFRNVFRLNGRHREARLTYAEILRGRGQMGEAYGHYLRLVEQYPDDLDGRRALGEMAVLGGDWEEAERHGRAARDLAPDDPTVAAVNSALDYRAARNAENAAEAERAVAAMRAQVEAGTAGPVAYRILIDAHLTDRNWDGALTVLEAALLAEPDVMQLHELKLRTLASLGDNEAVGAHLETMVDRFPDSVVVRDTLISWYIDSGAVDAAEAFLRRLAEDGDPEAAREAQIAVVQFLLRMRGLEPALAELDRLIAEGQDTPLWRHMRAGLDFDAGARTEAIAALEQVLADSPPSDQTRDIKVTLARMLEATGNEIGARARIAEVLAEDSAHVAALQMQAAWLIRDDRTGEAIAALRTALDQAPQSAETLTLMAEAHLRDGSRELAGERLALAVEVSGGRPAEALRYAAFLAADDRLLPAEGVLVEALRRAPADLDLLRALGELYLRLEDWPRTEATIARLDRIGGEAARGLANYLRVSLLYRQDRTEESVSLLERLIEQGDATIEAAGTVVQTHLRNGDPARAAAYVEALLAETPGHANLRLLRAGTHAILGETAEAEAIYRALLDEDPGNEDALLALYGLLRLNGRPGEASTALEAAIAATGGTTLQLFLRAVEYEEARDYEGAIAVYEELYDRDSTNMVIANNLASLLATHRTDDASLERAFILSRRLRSLDVPQYQDTYGWIEYRRGNHDEALSYLEAASEGLPDDPFVQAHLGLVYAALDRPAEARAQLVRALEIAGDTPSPSFDEARRVLAGLPGGDTGDGATAPPQTPQDPP